MNPFKDYGTVKADTDRYKLTIKRMPKDLKGRALDLGVVNPFTGILQANYPNLEVLNTHAGIDFDVDKLPYQDRYFDYVFSFEVLEHLMNPLWSLLECHRVLKDNGTIIMTTPKGIFPSTIMWPPAHFHEIDRSRVHTLFERAGLTINRIERFNKGPFYWWKMGILRPTLRILVGGWFYIESQKNNRAG